MHDYLDQELFGSQAPLPTLKELGISELVNLGLDTIKLIPKEDETVLQKGDMIVVCGEEPCSVRDQALINRARQIGSYSGFGVFYTGSLEMTDEVVRAILEQFPRPERMILSMDRTIINRVKIPDDEKAEP